MPHRRSVSVAEIGKLLPDRVPFPDRCRKFLAFPGIDIPHELHIEFALANCKYISRFDYRS